MDKSAVIITAKQYLKKISSEIDVKGAYLFGSYAKGNQAEDSDIDIAIVIRDMTNFFSVQMQLMRMRRDIDLRIEPHPISDKDFTKNNPFAIEIKETGIQLV